MIISTGTATCSWELTAREASVLKLLAEGWTDKEIAVHLDISVRTVRFHVGNVFRKMGATSRVQLAIKTLRQSAMNPIAQPDDAIEI